jgi:hypothetical protein
MSRDGTHDSLHHDLRGALSAIQMTLQTLEALERNAPNATPEKRLAIIGRGMSAVAEAVKLVDQLGPDPDPGGSSVA